jgi:hypothetical protein
VKDQRVQAGMAVNTWERMTDVENLIRSKHPTPRAELEVHRAEPAVTDHRTTLS